MALVIVNTPTTSASANSYVSLAEALAYITDRIPDTDILAAWSTLTANQKALYLVNASRALDTMVTWIGNKYSRDQGLMWPRYDAFVQGYYVNNILFPQAVKDATVEMAAWFMQNDGKVSVTENAAFDSIKVGPINIDFSEKVGGTKDKYFPDIVTSSLATL